MHLHLANPYVALALLLVAFAAAPTTASLLSASRGHEIHHSNEKALANLDLVEAKKFSEHHAVPPTAWTPNLVHRIFVNTLNTPLHKLDMQYVVAASTILPLAGYVGKGANQLDIRQLQLTPQQMLTLLALVNLDSSSTKVDNTAVPSQATSWGWSSMLSWGSAATKPSILSYFKIVDEVDLLTSAATTAKSAEKAVAVQRIILGYIRARHAHVVNATRPLRVTIGLPIDKLQAFLRVMPDTVPLENGHHPLLHDICVSSAVFLYAACIFSTDLTALVGRAYNWMCADEKGPPPARLTSVEFFSTLDVTPKVLIERIGFTIYPFSQRHCLAGKALQAVMDNLSLKSEYLITAWRTWLENCQKSYLSSSQVPVTSSDPGLENWTLVDKQ